MKLRSPLSQLKALGIVLTAALIWTAVPACGDDNGLQTSAPAGPATTATKSEYAEHAVVTPASDNAVGPAVPSKGNPVLTEAQAPAPVPAETGDTGGTWSQAGNRIKEAARAVGEASGESWNATRKGVSGALDVAKEKTGELWDKARTSSGQAWENTTEVTEEAASVTVEKSREVWEITKETSAGLLEGAREKIHELTAPANKTGSASAGSPVSQDENKGAAQ